MPAVCPNGFGDAVAHFRFREKYNASTSSGAADLCRLRSAAERGFHELLDSRRSDARSVGLPQLPFIAQEMRNILPVGQRKRVVHGTRDLGNALKIAEYLLVAVDVRLEHLPV